VARGTQHRKRRPAANARVAAQPVAQRGKQRPTRPAWEQQLFFGKLRKRFKWVMILLGVVFLFTFVLLGVGSGSTGISDVLSNFFSGSSSTGSSISALQNQTTQHPKDAAAFLALANKLLAAGQDDAAAAALTTYTTLRPKDQNALLQLAGVYLRRANDWNTLYSNSQARAQALTPTPLVSPSSASALGQALNTVTTPITSAASNANATITSNEYSEVISYLDQRESVYKKLAQLSPADAITQYSLAQAASEAGDTKTAIAAFKAFLKLAPSDSQAPAARAALKQLEAQQKAASAGSAAASGSTKAATKKKSKSAAKKKS
jgi:cytochrome c-type biogenesis protein CcmH/NrfG